VDSNQGGQLLARVRALRQNLAQQLGFFVPPSHITDNVRLKAKEYTIALRGVEVARWELYQDNLLAISSEGSPRPLPGVATKEPAFGAAAVWIPPALQNQALASGYAVVDQTSVLATHLAEVVKQHAHELLTRQESKRLLDRLAESHPKLVEELVPKILSLGNAEGLAAAVARTGFNSRSGDHSRNFAGPRAHQQEPSAAGRVGAAGAGAGAGASAAFGKRKPARGHARSRAGRRARPRLRRARAARDKYNRPAASVCPPHSRRPAPSGRRAGGPGESSAALRHAGTLSPEAVARTFPAQGGGSFAHGGASRGRNSIAGGFALRRF